MAECAPRGRRRAAGRHRRALSRRSRRTAGSGFMSEMSRAVERGILDTSTVVHLEKLSDFGDLPAEPLITTVTLAELAVGPLVARDDSERARRQANLQQAE